MNDKINYERGEKMELIDIVNENNEFTGQIEEREIAYEKGLWRRTVSCWIMNEKGEILLQKRSSNKKKNPNK
jgi:isopentenyl-diphosphate delta-isomerase